MRVKVYILDNRNNAVPCVGPEEYLKFMEKPDHKRVAYDERGGVIVSTVFLTTDHGWAGGAPVLWETMVFGGEHDEYQQRYTSHANAIAGHAECVKKYLGEQPCTNPY